MLNCIDALPVSTIAFVSLFVPWGIFRTLESVRRRHLACFHGVLGYRDISKRPRWIL